MPDLLSPLTIGTYTLPTRVVMAPLTRCRCPQHIPTALNAEYYAQRADPRTGCALIISEATIIAPEGAGYPNTPGLYSDAQVAGWRLVTDALHAKGGRIFAQLWHVGSISHPDYQPGGALPVSASAVNPGGESTTPDGSRKPRVAPRALDRDEIPAIMAAYTRAAENAMRAGFDGVELHGANGYLPHQFLSDASNTRTDDYGGSLENRARFMLQAADACIAIWGPARVGVRLSPNTGAPVIQDSNPVATFSYVVSKLAERNVGYLHIMESAPGWTSVTPPVLVRTFRPLYRGPLITNAGFTYDKAQEYIRRGDCDAVAFGRAMIANPDLTARFRRLAAGETGVPMNEPNPDTFYSSGANGYVDYPTLAQ